jgi:predicted acyl esterase
MRTGYPSARLSWFAVGILGIVLGSCGPAAAADPFERVSGGTVRSYQVPMSDGVRLSTDVCLPDGTGPWPVVLVRTPYGKARSGRQRVSLPWTRDGWVYVVQDTRGRGASDGADIAFEADGWLPLHDGEDTVKWIVAQPWCDGRVATVGGSALGIAQYGLAGTGLGSVVAQHIPFATGDMYSGVYRQGVFRKGLIEGWLKVFRYDPATLALWTSHSRYDDYWEQRNLSERYRLVDAAAVHEGGWFDIFTQGTLDAFAGYNESGGPRARGRQRLIMGPWTHGSTGNRAGELTFRDANLRPGLAASAQAWLDYAVKGADNGIGSDAPVLTYVMGDTTDPSAPGNAWRASDRWPRPDARPFSLFLHPDRKADFVPPRDAEDALSWTSDPAHPVPSVGGPELSATGLAAGPMDQAAVETRPDVLVFTTDPFPAPLEIDGRITARLWIGSDAPDTDIVVRMCMIGANGRSYNIAEGAIRARFWRSIREEHLLEKGKVYPVSVDLWSTSIIFNRGNRIRVDVASSSYPAYEVNPNNGLPLGVPGRSRVAHNRVFLSRAFPSELVLPVAPFRDDGAVVPK